MYRPNFCADCGARVERARWRPWTSRRFCPACEGRFRRGRIARPLLLCASLLALGFALGRSGRAPAPPLILERGELSTAAPPGGVAGAAGSPDSARAGGSAEQEAAAPAYGPDGTERERPTDPAEIVSVCGARTQKGTPCSRRVRGTGRCWQHRGRPAMLPPGKLVVPN